MLLGVCEVGSALYMAELDINATEEARTGTKALIGFTVSHVNNWRIEAEMGSDTHREGPKKPHISSRAAYLAPRVERW
jgi:hypothetical protein